jgi:uncharacterized protein YbaR (Trm112 family)
VHLALSDLMTCPGCGPGFGLVLLPDQVRGRRVATGVLGCPGCRQRFPIVDGVADLRPADVRVEAAASGGLEGAGAAEPGGAGRRPSADEPVRLAALLGLERVSGLVALAGPFIACAPELAELVDQVEVAALMGFGGPLPVVRGEISAFRIGGPVLPFRDAALSGAALAEDATALFEEALRVIRPAARLVLEPATDDLRDRARAAGAVTVLDAPGTLVVARGA